ncbi:translocation/assembly module TamB domain-containing protein [Glaciimonas soli]|nr:translocation/assembly module TamB domain-containing protein [Glaciimonas soli]
MNQASTPPPDQSNDTAPTPSSTGKVPGNGAIHAVGAMLRGLVALFLIVVLLLVLAALTIWVGVRSEVGTQKIWQTATSLSQGHLTGEFVGGTLNKGIRLRNVQFQDKTQRYVIDKIDGGWSLNFSPLKFTVDHLHVGTVDAYIQPTPSEPTVLPQSLTLPLALELHNIQLDKLSLHERDSTTELSNLSLHGDSDGRQHHLVVENLDTPYGKANANANLDGQSPFIITGDVALSGAYEQEKYQLNANVSGNLSALKVLLKGNGDKLSATANIAVTPFAPIPFERIQLSANHINPKLFSEGAPLADLSLQADLVPVSPAATGNADKADNIKADTGKAPDLALLAVSGPLHISNAIPGAIDKDHLPLISADAQVRLDAHTQTLTSLQIKLQENATITGSGHYYTDGKEKNNGAFDFNVANLNLQALHGKLQPSQLRGPISVKLTEKTQEIALDLADNTLSAKIDALIDSKQINIKSAQLAAQAGARPSRLDLTGSLSRDPQMVYAAKGQLRDFDPAVWMKISGASASAKAKSNGAKPINARINMTFDAAGKVSPELQLKLKFGILDSEYNNLPMSGNGTINLIGKRLLPSDAALSIAGNDAQLNGSFGNSNDQLHVKINAPQLERLGFGLSGAVQVDGQVTGTLQRPAVRATYRAEKVIFGEHRVDSLSGDADIQTDLNAKVSAAGNRLQLNLDASGYHGPGVVLNKLNAHLSGTFADHTLKLDSTGTVHEKPMALTLAAQGKLTESVGGYGWQGSVNELKNQGTPNFALEAPLAITASVAASGTKVTLGATRLTIANAVIALKNFSFDNGRLRSAGEINALNINTVLDLVHEFTDKPVAVKSDLVLDSSWDFALAESASGFIQIARRSGDVRSSSGIGGTALGLSELRTRIDFSGTQMQLNAALVAERVGTLNAALQLGLKQQGAILLPVDNSPLSGTIKANVPELKKVGSLFGPQIGMTGSLGLNLKLDGVLSQPKLSGALNGDQLAVTLFDQGIQLRDGSARINVTENVIDLQQLIFHGGDGTISASGRLQLGRANPDLSATIVADHLQLFASPDRQLMLSGQAKVANVNEQLHVDGKFVVNKALFDLPKDSAPTLGDDVVIVSKNDGATRATPLTDKEQMEKAAGKKANGMTPIMNIGVDFGDDFRFRGSGADLRLAGVMNVNSEPYKPLRATGSIRVAEGTYEVFGVKLAIERGLINFQGPINNPNISILAMRRNQDVAAGAEITGYPSTLRVKLVSDPNVSDEEKLSWMMFGHGSDSSAVGQRQAAGAALALLGNYGGKKIASGLGLDEFSIGNSESGLVDTQVVNIGKAITQKINIGYEQGISTAESILKLTWQFSRRWSLTLQGGTINGFDVLYNRRFDKFWRDRKSSENTEDKDGDHSK